MKNILLVISLLILLAVSSSLSAQSNYPATSNISLKTHQIVNTTIDEFKNDLIKKSFFIDPVNNILFLDFEKILFPINRILVQSNQHCETIADFQKVNQKEIYEIHFNDHPVGNYKVKVYVSNGLILEKELTSHKSNLVVKF